MDSSAQTISGSGPATDRKQTEADISIEASADLCQHRLFETLSRFAAVGVAQVSLDGAYLRVNDRLCGMLGYSREELCSLHFADVTHPDDVPGNLTQAHRLCRGEITTFETRKRYRRKDGLTVWGHLSTSVVRAADGRPEHLLSIILDITEQVVAEQALQESEERLALAARGGEDVLWDWDLQTGRVHFAPRWAEILGCPPEGIGDGMRDWFARIRPSDLPQFQADLTVHLAGHSSRLRNEHRLLHRDGTERWVLCRGMAVRDEQGQPIRLTGWITEISEQKALEAELHREAMTDRLTGLPNRAFFHDRLVRAIGRSRHDPASRFAVLLLDFDRFKVVNDSLGHALGDRLLVSIATRLNELVRGVDVAARLGGDEFVVLLHGVAGRDEVEAVARRLVHAFNAPHDLGEHEVTSTASIGVVLGEGQYTSPDDVLRDADTAMYHAKDDGKGRWTVFDGSMHERVLERLHLEKDLRRALERNELHLAYQPIVCLYTGDTVGFEALLRWSHPRLGNIPPDQFIPLAEETGLIVPVGAWVLRQACAQLAAWKRQEGLPRLTMNINVSKRQLAEPGFLDLLGDTIADAGLQSRDLHLEITESVIMDGGADILPVLDAVRSRGVPLAMDDFGTGHSSLSRLHQFPIDVLKIDKQFVRNIDDAAEFAIVIQAIVTLAHALNIEVIAEGIETPEQLVQLQSLDCDQAQGYYFARPLSAEDAEAFLWRSLDRRKIA